jgi:tight adherence protein C
MTWSPLGGLAGLLFAAGLWLVVARLPFRRRPGLDARLAPYLVGLVPGVPRTAPAPAGGVLRGGPAALLVALGHRVELALGGGSTGVRHRLDQLGPGGSPEQFRAEQVLCGIAGAGLGAVLGSAGALAGRGVSAVPLLGLMVIGGTLGVLGRDQLLTWRVRRRQERMMDEFPTVAELLALAVGAGEGAVGALDRVSRTCRGELSAELRRTLAAARTGASLVDALGGMAARTSLPGLARFVDGITVAVERGTPLADVLRAQAQDARTQARRRLMESGGRREIAMMVPVVFGVLPVTVLFAVYPGLAVLDLAG